MARDFVEAFTSVSAATTYTAMTGSPYSITKASTLVGAKLEAGSDAVTTLIEMVVVKLSSKQWGAREVIISLSGGGLRTAPAFPIPAGIVEGLGLPCPLGTVIIGQVKNETGATPITPRYSVTLVLEN